MFAHAGAIPFANLFHPRAIIILVDHINDQARDLVRLAAGLCHDRENILERLIELLDDVVADDLLLFVPGNLSGDEEQPSARFGQDPVRIATRRTERFRVDESETHIAGSADVPSALSAQRENLVVNFRAAEAVNDSMLAPEQHREITPRLPAQSRVDCRPGHEHRTAALQAGVADPE